MMMALCYGCHVPFMSNPERVPSFRGEPLCRSCIARLNELRIERGLEPFAVAPDAYEPVEVDE